MVDQQARTRRTVSGAPTRPPVRDPRPSPEVFRRRRIVVGSAAGAVVLGVGLVTAFGWPGFAVPDPLPTPTTTVTAPVPTPTISPAARKGEQTAFSKALPDTVLAYVQTKVVNLAAWQDEHDAVEAWTVTYAAGTEADAPTVTLDAGQWADGKAATSYYEAQAEAAGKALKSGDVEVKGKKVGAYVVAAGEGGDAVLWWRNDTAVLRAQGPQDAIEAFYSAYPL